MHRPTPNRGPKRFSNTVVQDNTKAFSDTSPSTLVLTRLTCKPLQWRQLEKGGACNDIAQVQDLLFGNGLGAVVGHREEYGLALVI